MYCFDDMDKREKADERAYQDNVLDHIREEQMNGDRLLDFEESKYEELVEGFVRKFRDEWECYVELEFEKSCEEYEPPDNREDR